MHKARSRQLHAKTGSAFLVAWALVAAMALGQPPPEQPPPEPATAAVEPESRTPSAASTADRAAIEPATVVVWNRPIAVFRAAYGALLPAERAAGAKARIEALPLAALRDPVEWRDVTDGRQNGVLISTGATVLFGLLEEDVDINAGETLESANTETVRRLEELFAARLEQRRPSVVLRTIGWSIASVFVVLATLLVGRRIRRWVLRRIEAIPPAKVKVVGFDLWPFAAGIARGLINLAMRIAVAAVAYVLLTLTLRQLPYTRPWGERLGGWVIDLLRELATGLLAAVPGVIVVLLIFFATRFVVRTVDVLLERAKAEEHTTPWLHSDTIDATRRIAKVFIWLFAVVVAYPYIPGSNTTAFKGISVFAGIVLSLGSSGLVNQILSGFLLTYSRALREGDLVQIGDTFGRVTHIGVLSTKILTPKLEEITIPNTVVVSTSVVNYARVGALLSTTLTIGYDTPWRQVHSLLLLAAERTSGIRREPPPTVLQRALSDFFVEYELRCALEVQLDRMIVLSSLHSQILDAFNEFGVQIMVPHWEGQPEGRIVAPRESWFAAPARPLDTAEAKTAGDGGAPTP